MADRTSLAGAVFLAGMFAVALATRAPSAQSVSICGAGIIVRSDTSVMIDRWTTYAAPATPNAPNVAPGPPTSTPAPSKVILGESLGDDVRIGLERADATVYVTLGEIRRLAAAGKPKL